MIGLDTNVLVRYIVRDDPRQTKAATRLIESKCTPDDPGLIASIVLCEIVWVLDRAYGYDREVISTVLRRLLTVEELQVQESELAWSALNFYEEGKADFADYMIGLSNQIQHVETTFTLDQEAAATSLFRLLTT
jgi:predicted nucleic-acid-binding protein